MKISTAIKSECVARGEYSLHSSGEVYILKWKLVQPLKVIAKLLQAIQNYTDFKIQVHPNFKAVHVVIW